MSRSLTPQAYMEKAERALSAARILLNADNAEGACNRAYYAMFDAANAALIAVNIGVVETTIKTHAGLIGAFGKHLVQAGLIDAGHGRGFNQVHSLRQLADYTGDPTSVDDAAWALNQAEAFVNAVKAQLSMG